MDSTKVFINGRSEYVYPGTYTYEEIVELAGKKGQPTVVYSRGPEEKESGSLIPGQYIDMVDGMVWCVMHTGNA